MQGAVTYPEPTVAETVTQRFVPVQVNVQEEAAGPLIERYRQFWTPDVRLLGSDGFEYYRWNGYLSPFEFVPQLLVGQAQACLRMHDEPGAAALYDEVLRFGTEYPISEKTLSGRLKQAQPVVDHLHRKWEQDKRKIPQQ